MSSEFITGIQNNVPLSNDKYLPEAIRDRKKLDSYIFKTQGRLFRQVMRENY